MEHCNLTRELKPLKTLTHAFYQVNICIRKVLTKLTIHITEHRFTRPFIFTASPTPASLFSCQNQPNQKADQKSIQQWFFLAPLPQVW